MGSLMASGLVLDRRVLSAPSIGGFLTQVSRIHDQSERLAKLDDYVSGLQVEIQKIEAFKRELPICVGIVNDAMVIMKEELEQYKKPMAVKEFIPLKTTNDDKDEKNDIGKENDINSSDKMNWMNTLQLCTSISEDNNQILKLEKNKGFEVEMNPPIMSSILTTGTSVATGTAFEPFKGRNNLGKEDGDELNGLTPLYLRIKNPGGDIVSGGFSFKSSCSRTGSTSATGHQSNLQARQKHQPMTRKQRRCWSPELHHRFTDALQQLGGAQAATPKQIRELMRVDGLSNDEVKSHLQKYRIHNRKASTSFPSTDLVVLGGSWMSKDNKYTESSKLGRSHSASPQATGGHSPDYEDMKMRSWSL